MTVLTQEPLALARRGVALYGGVEQRVVAVLRRVAPTLLRVSLGLVFVWFGALKVANLTPVGDLVAGTLPFVDPVGSFRCSALWRWPWASACCWAGRSPLVCAVLVAHLCGTFLVLVMQPELAFQNGNPLLLTTIGEFVVKNVVLISAALVLAARLREAKAA